MSTTKSTSKSMPSKNKVKRKRGEETDYPTLAEEQPSNKSRRKKVISVSMSGAARDHGTLMDAKPKSTIGSGSDLEDETAPEAYAEEETLLGGFSSESDSSDEDMEVGDEPPLDVSNLPSFSKDDAVVQQKLKKARKHPIADLGVVYLGRIPHGFYEDQMRAYFTQFGEVTRLRLSRNKKTGRSKHYGFLEFSSSAVAEIVSETMDNYLLLGHILQCKVIPKDQIHPELWVGANKKWKRVPKDRVPRTKQNKSRTQEERQHAESKLLARQKKKESKIRALGIEYDFEEVAYKQAAKEPVGVGAPA